MHLRIQRKVSIGCRVIPAPFEACFLPATACLAAVSTRHFVDGGFKIRNYRKRRRGGYGLVEKPRHESEFS